MQANQHYGRFGNDAAYICQYGRDWLRRAFSRLSRTARHFCVWLALLPVTFAAPGHAQNLTISTSIPGLVIRTRETPKRIFIPGSQSELPERQLRTSTPEGEVEMTFSGVSLSDLLDPSLYKRKNVLAISENGNSIGFSLEDAVRKGAFVAYAKNGRRLGDYGQGPYWIIFPWSENPALDTPSVHAMSVWRLVELRLE